MLRATFHGTARTLGFDVDAFHSSLLTPHTGKCVSSNPLVSSIWNNDAITHQVGLTLLQATFEPAQAWQLSLILEPSGPVIVELEGPAIALSLGAIVDEFAGAVTAPVGGYHALHRLRRRRICQGNHSDGDEVGGKLHTFA